MTWDGGTNTGTASLTVNNTITVSDWSNQGVMTINAGGVLNNSVSDIVGYGGQITVNPGGLLNTDSDGSGAMLQVSNSLLVNNGTINGITNVNYGALASGTGSYGTVILNTGGTFQAGAGPIASPSVTAPVGYIKSTSGSFTVTGAVKLAADTVATVSDSSDTLTLAGSLSASGMSLSKEGAGTLSLRAVQAQGLYVNSGGVSILPGSGTSCLNALSISASGKLDLTNNSMIVNYSGGSPAADIRQMLASGYGPGDWSGTTGITSSFAHGDTDLRHTLAYGEASRLGITSLGGQTITGTAVVIKYTNIGDSNLDGIVDLDNDFSLFVDGYNKQLSDPTSLNPGNLWASGDYNYDGVIDLDNDFSLFVDAYAKYQQDPTQLAVIRNVINSMDLTITQKNAMLASVPEPASLGLVALAAAPLFARRRRQK